MTVYVRVDPINGRYQFTALAEKLELWGFKDRVEYSQGYWVDQLNYTYSPHLKFEDEDDALAYVLAVGGEVLRELSRKK